jgi:hypothetical protein
MARFAALRGCGRCVRRPAFLREQAYDALVLGALAHRTKGTTPVGTLTSTLLDALDCDFVLVKSSSYRSPIDNASA